MPQLSADIEQVASSINESTSIANDVWNLYKQVETQSENIKSQWKTAGGEVVYNKLTDFRVTTLKNFIVELEGYLEKLGVVSDILDQINEQGVN